MNTDKLNRLRIPLIALLILVVGAAGFVIFYNQLRSKSKAAPTGTPELSLVAVNNPPMDASNNIRIAVDVNPNGATTSLYAFDVQVTYDSSKLDYQFEGGVAANVFLPQGEMKLQVTQVDPNTIRIVGTRTGTPIGSTSKRIAEISFKLKEGQDFPMTFNWGTTVLETLAFVKVPLTLNSNSSGGSSSAAGNPVTLSVAPGSATYDVGNLVLVDIMLNTSGKQIGSATVNLSYDQSKLTYSSTAVNTAIFNGTSVTPPPSGSTLNIRANRNSGTAGNLKVATIRFTAKAAGTASFTLNKSASAVMTVGSSPQNILTAVSNASISISAQSSSANSSSSINLGGGSGTPGEHVESNGDLLHINSRAFDQAPLRYEQTVKLEKGDYILSGSARVYTVGGRGVLITLACGEASCGDGKRLNDVFGQTPLFALSKDFQLKEATIHISDNQKDKKLVVRIFVEDGSEADFDYVSLTDVWGGERLTNWHFEKIQKVVSPRVYPQYWSMDSAGQILSTTDKQQGVDGSLFINSSSRQ